MLAGKIVGHKRSEPSTEVLIHSMCALYSDGVGEPPSTVAREPFDVHGGDALVRRLEGGRRIRKDRRAFARRLLELGLESSRLRIPQV